MVAIHCLLLIVLKGTRILKLRNQGATENGMICKSKKRLKLSKEKKTGGRREGNGVKIKSQVVKERNHRRGKRSFSGVQRNVDIVSRQGNTVG